MNLQDFWETIERASIADDICEGLAGELQHLSPEEIRSFQSHFDTLLNKANLWDLYGAANIMEGGCSEEGFVDFRNGLISRGREFYEQVVKSPDSLAEVVEDDDWISFEEFGYVAGEIYEEKTGGEIPRPDFQDVKPMGKMWDFEDEAVSRKHLPKLYAKFMDDEFDEAWDEDDIDEEDFEFDEDEEILDDEPEESEEEEK